MSILERKLVWRRDEAERKRLPNTLSHLERDNVQRGLRDNVQRGLRVLRMRYGMSGLAARMGLTCNGMRKTCRDLAAVAGCVLHVA